MEKKKKKRPVVKPIVAPETIKIVLPHPGCTTDTILTGKHAIEGAKTIYISPKTQEVIKCLNGRDVTSENPWIEVKKESIEDNLFFYEDASDFYSIKDEIEQYPEEIIFMGWIANNVNYDRNDYLLCLSLEAKNGILDLIESEIADAKTKIIAAFGMTISIWNSQGSELEVNDCLPKSFRNAYEIELETPFPVYPVRSRFSLRLAEYTQNGYVEILPGRFASNLVFRKRYDACAQTGFGKQNRAIQTHAACPKGRPTQYEYEYRQITLAEDSLVDLAAFFRNYFPIYSKLLNNNVKLDIYYDDYNNLAISEEAINAATPTEILNFKNVSVCKGLKVCALSWNPLISGLLAIGYSRIPKNIIIDKESDVPDKGQTDITKNIVLIWSYTNYLKPQFFLYSPREVSVLSWCPYKENILIGGLDNGQLAIWDFGSKLMQIDMIQVLSPKEQRQRDILASRMTWMKPLNKNEMYPAAVSDIVCSHRCTVTCITWMHEGYYINRNGRWSEASENNQHTQFLTSGMDCTVLAWDLDTKPYTVKKFDEIIVNKPVKKSSVFSRDAIAAGKSEFKVMDSLWYPSYKWRVESDLTRHRYPIMNITLSNQRFGYTAINNSSITKVFERTFYEAKKVPVIEPFSLQLYLSTNTGLLLDSYWEGINYDQGLKTNSEILHATEYGNVHDGPIISCEQHPIDQDMFLTIGGKICAVWDARKKQSPFFWRRSPTRYSAGVWLENHPCTILLARMDFYIEYWNLLQQTKLPTRSVRLTGINLIGLFATYRQLHVNKNTLVIADSLGSARVFRTDSCVFGLSDEELKTHPSSVRFKIEARKNTFNTWLEALKLQSQYVEDKQISHLNLYQPTKLTKQFVTSKANMEYECKLKKLFDNTHSWETAEEQIMYQNLLVKKRINLCEIESSKGPMMNIIQEKERKFENLQKKIEMRETIYKDALKSLMQRKVITQRKRYKVSVSKETENKVKKSYIRDYVYLEEEALKFLKRRSHAFSINKGNMSSQKRIPYNI